MKSRQTLTVPRSALSVAIAGALAVPMAAQAVDFTISGHVNRALFMVDTVEGSNQTMVEDNSSSGTRIRANGSTDLDNGTTVGIQFEYGAGDTFSLRHANVQYGGGFGKITLGQGSEAGDGSQYSDPSGVFGIGHGQHKTGAAELGDYFGSLDGGGRVEMIRYDAPSFGPTALAFSLAKGDSKLNRVSGLAKYSGDFGSTSVVAQLAMLKEPGDKSNVGASAGITLPSGLTLSGAWAKGKKQGGTAATDPSAMLGTGECPEDDESCTALGTGEDAATHVLITQGKAATPATDPSYLQTSIGYKFGNSAVAVSWYKSDDFVAMGSEGTALGAGVKHTLPKAKAELYAAVQNYDVKETAGAASKDETVFVIGSRVKF